MGRIMRGMGVVFLASAAACLLAACGGGGAGDNGTVTSSVQSQGVRYTLSAPAVSQQGQNVALTYTMTNTSGAALDLATLPTAPLVSVYDKDGTQVWSFPSETTAAFRNSGTLAPGASYDYVATWNQSISSGGSRNGAVAGPGTYQVKVAAGASSLQVAIAIAAAPANSLAIVPEGNGVFVVQAGNLSNVAGMNLTVGYDTTLYSSPVVTQGTFVSGATFAANTATPGAIKIALVNTTPFSGSGAIAIITFTNATRNQGALPTLSSVNMIDSSGQPVK